MQFSFFDSRLFLYNMQAVEILPRFALKEEEVDTVMLLCGLCVDGTFTQQILLQKKNTCSMEQHDYPVFSRLSFHDSGMRGPGKVAEEISATYHIQRRFN